MSDDDTEDMEKLPGTTPIYSFPWKNVWRFSKHSIHLLSSWYSTSSYSSAGKGIVGFLTS